MAAHAGTVTNLGDVVTITFNGTIDQENDYTGGTGMFGATSLVGQPISGTVIFNTSEFTSLGNGDAGFENSFYVNLGSSIQFSEDIAGQTVSWSGVAGDAQSAVYLYQYSIDDPSDSRTQITAYGSDAATGSPENKFGGFVSLLSDGQLFSDFEDLSSIFNGSSGSDGATETWFWDAQTGYYDYVIFDDFTYNVQVVPVSTSNAVPEPSTLTIMLIGLGGVAVALRFQRRGLAT